MNVTQYQETIRKYQENIEAIEREVKKEKITLAYRKKQLREAKEAFKAYLQTEWC